MRVCVMAGKSSDGSGVAITSPVHRLHPDKLQSWSSSFRSNSRHSSLSLSSQASVLPREHSLPVHANASQPFKPVGCSTAQLTADNSLRKLPPQTVSSECPLPSACMSANRFSLSSPCSVSSECPLPSEHTPADSCQQMCVSSKYSLISSLHSSFNEEDPTAPSCTVHSPVLQSVDDTDTEVSFRPLPHTATSEPKLSAAARISMALSEFDTQPQSINNGDVGHESPSLQKYLTPTTKISMALTERSSQIGRRLSTMLHNSRLHQHSSSAAGMMS